MGSIESLAVVTGGNGAIGLEIVRGIAQHKVKAIVVLTARNSRLGEEAVKLLNQEGLSNVVFHQLDINDSSSINSFVGWIKGNSKGLDILVNNAGVGTLSAVANNASERAKTVIGTNYFGTRRVTEALLGCLKPGARIINVSSAAARLDLLTDETWKEKLLDSENLTDELIEQFVEEYVEKLRSGRGHEMINRAEAGYNISKMALNAYSQLLARRLEEKRITVTCMCPGYTSSSITMWTGHPASLGADTAVWLATAEAGDKVSTGKFYVNRECVESLLAIPGFFDGRWYRSSEDWTALTQMVKDFVGKKS